MRNKLSILIILAVVFILVTFNFGCSSKVAPTEIVENLEDMIEDNTPGDNGPVMASVEGDKIYKKYFDLQLDMFLKNSSSLSPEQQVKMKNSPRFLSKLLQNIIDTKVILKEVKIDKDFKNNTEFLIFLNMQLAEGIKQYYIYKKLGDKVDSNVTDKEIAALYNKAKKEPRYRKAFARMDLDKIKIVLKNQILEQRQKLMMRKVINKLRSKYRIVTKDNTIEKKSSEKKTDSKKKNK